MVLNKTSSFLVCLLIIVKSFYLNIECAFIDSSNQKVDARSHYVSPCDIAVNISRINSSQADLVSLSWSDFEDPDSKMFFGSFDSENDSAEVEEVKEEPVPLIKHFYNEPAPKIPTSKQDTKPVFVKAKKEPKGHEFGNGYGIYVDPETGKIIDILNN